MVHKPTVEVATKDDLEAILGVYLDAFSGDAFTTIFPPGPGDEYHKIAWGAFLGVYDRIPGMQECKIYIIRDDSGTVKSVALVWIVKPQEGGLKHWKYRWPQALPGMNAAAMSAFYEDMAAQHCAVMGEQAHIYLEIIMTHESARKQGHASSLLAKTTSLADELGYAMYLDADENAMGLYRKYGFEHRADVEKTSRMFPMMRAKK